ncbi:hypothetical protein CEXT_58841 [Caerostris extrusa]|uniref:Uncharacterized protein n=1 Tax=Caerostris extrusa TaxID=172846 RepID=A0AAV4QSC3_CAEEX|nr:hypothetical protein CEXT_58841 [Caerostris extrusa]
MIVENHMLVFANIAECRQVVEGSWEPVLHCVIHPAIIVQNVMQLVTAMKMFTVRESQFRMWTSPQKKNVPLYDSIKARRHSLEIEIFWGFFFYANVIFF